MRASVARTPTVVDLVFGLLALAIPIGSGYRLVNSDGDLPRHLRMGEVILAGGPFQPDVFSHTRYGEPFLTTEWLSQVAYALAHRAGGLAGVAVLASLVIAATYALVALFLRRRGVDPATAYLVTIAAAALGSIHWLARPHLFTLLGCALTLHLLEGRAKAWVYPVLFAVWANFHPGFVLGLALLAVYAAGEFIEAKLHPEHAAGWRRRARGHAAGAALGAAGAMLNPQGPAFFARIVAHLNDEFLLAVTQEFGSPSFHDTWGRALLLAIGAVFFVTAVRRTRPTWPRLLTIGLLLAGALAAQRNVPIFTLVALPLLALDSNVALRAHTRGVLARTRTILERREASLASLWLAAPLLVLLPLAANGGRLGGAPLLPAAFDPATFPVAAVAHARAERLDGRLFNDMAWGGYVLLAWPEQRIFIDGMTDFFGEDIARAYLRVALVHPGWREELERHGVEVALVRTGSALAYALAHEPAWHAWYRDDVAAIYRRAAEAAP
jgi:hypothetical protein